MEAVNLHAYVNFVASAVCIYDNTAATPDALYTPVNGTRFIAQVTANGWTANHIYEWNNPVWIDTTPVYLMALAVDYANTIQVQAVLDIFDNTAALPLFPAPGDRYIALVTANGWTINRIYQWNGANWVETIPVLTNIVLVRASGLFYVYQAAGWTTTPQGTTQVLQWDGANWTNAGLPALYIFDGLTWITAPLLTYLTIADVPYCFYADQLTSPNNADWAINALAPANADSLNNALIVRAFDDTAVEGVGFTIEIPADATGMIIGIRGRAQTAPGAAKQVILNLYARAITDNTAVGAWSGAQAMTAIDIPTNTRFQFDTDVSQTFAALGITPGSIAQFELVRNGADGNDTLVGDWNLLELMITFT
jgi:hypothetical protein